jgi:hypothetical protein
MTWAAFIERVRVHLSSTSSTPTNPVPSPVAPLTAQSENNRIMVVVPLRGHLTATEALTGNNPHTDVAPGEYFIFNRSGDAVNVSRSVHDPGSWINSKLNILPTTSQTPEEITVDNAVADGVLTSREHWIRVLKGEIPANAEFIKIAFDRYHEKLKIWEGTA